jgi:hypothetical protein
MRCLTTCTRASKPLASLTWRVNIQRDQTSGTCRWHYYSSANSNRPHPSEVVRGSHPVRAALHLPHAPPSVPECPVWHPLALRRCRSQFRPNCSSFLMVADHSFEQESACRNLVGVRVGERGVVVGKCTAGARNYGLLPNFGNPLVPAPPQTCST